jgi:hypothetical protein
MAESKHGGARDGSGRKPKAPTTTINFRVPVDKVPYLKPLVSTYIKGLLNPSPAMEAEVPPIQELPVKPAKKAVVKEVKEPVSKKAVEKEPTMAELLRQVKL